MRQAAPIRRRSGRHHGSTGRRRNVSIAATVKSLGYLSVAEQLLVTGLVEFEKVLGATEREIEETIAKLQDAKLRRAEIVAEIDGLKASIAAIGGNPPSKGKTPS